MNPTCSPHFLTSGARRAQQAVRAVLLHQEPHRMRDAGVHLDGPRMQAGIRGGCLLSR